MRQRTLSGLVAAAVAPRWPVPVARQASLHTWSAEDPIGDVEYAHELSGQFANLKILRTAGRDHTLPAAQPDLLVRALQGKPG